MLRVAIFLIVIAAVAAGLAWLADRPGEMLINWQGYEFRTSVFHAIVILAMLIGLSILLWSIARGIWQSPAAIGGYFNRRREKRGLEALSSGMIAIGAGDKSLATRYAIQARKSLPNEPMTHLLRAQAARLAGDQTTSRRIFEAMLSSPDTEQLGLRGLFLEAEKEEEPEAARQFADRAMKLNPKLTWPVDALLGLQSKQRDWAGALETLNVAKKHGHLEKSAVDRKRAVLLTAQAQSAEDNDPERAMSLALEAHGLAPELIPAAAIAGRLLAARGSTPKAVKVIAKTWKKAPHPDLAIAYAYARLGDSPKDRLDRVKKLAALAPNVIESPIALANAAIDAQDFDAARSALQNLDESRKTQRVCTLMARVEGETGNAGGVREWLARAVNAPRDPAWTADGVVADDWGPVSPVTGALDAFQWRVPVEAAEPRDKDLLAQKIDELVKVGARSETALAASAAASAAGTAASSADDVDAASKPAGRSADGAVDAEVVDVVKVISTDAAAQNANNSRPAANAGMKVVDMSPPEKKVPEDVSKVETPKADASTADKLEVAATPASSKVPSEPAVSPEVTKSEPVATPASGTTPKDSKATANGSGNHGGRESVASQAPEVVLTKTENRESATSKKVVASDTASSTTAEPKIFVSPRAPDDPGLKEDAKK